jgi:hypothetical protein
VGALSNIYDWARAQLLTANLDWLGVELVVSAWSGTPTFVPTDVTIANVKSRGAVERAYSLPVAGTSVSIDGTAKSDPVVIPTVPVGAPILWFTMSEVAVPHDTSKLILFLNDVVPPLPFIPNGLDLVLTPDWSAGRGWWRP